MSGKICEVILRVLALLLTLGAAIVIGLNKQTLLVPVQFAPTFPFVEIEVEAKWHYLSALVYSLVANIIASSYAAISTLVTLAAGKRDVAFAQVIIIFDAIVVGLLFSANGASLAVGLIGYKGNSHLQWNKVCNVLDHFCDKVAISVVMSLVASFVFIALVSISVLSLQNRFAPRT